MAKLIHMKRKTARRHAGRSRSGRIVMRSSGKASGASGRSIKGLLLFIRRNYKLLSIGAAVVAVGIVCLIVFLGNADKPASGEVAQAPESSPSPVNTLPGTLETYDYSAVDESVLAGLAGTDESLFTDEEELADSLFAEEGIRIGVTLGKIDSVEDEQILSRLEEVTNAAENQKLVYEVYYYNANGNYNQQIQDVRSLIKNKVDAIIVGLSDANSFNMVSMMAREEGIPVIALDAPVQSGYAVNVMADQQAWGAVYGEFMAEQLAAGNLVGIWGSQSDANDSARQSAVSGILAGVPQITVVGTSYAEWKKEDAKAAMAAFLTAGQVDGVITEEGMAEGVLDAFIEAGKLPRVMCADVTAGFIKKWYALKNGGLSIASKTEDKQDEDGPEPTPTPAVMLAQPGEMTVCAQPAPAAIGTVAFEIALRLAEGDSLVKEGETYSYQVNALITDENLGTYYEQIKDKEDSYAIRDFIVESDIDALFSPTEALES